MSIEFKEKDVGAHVLHFAHVPEASDRMPMFLFHGGDPQFNGWHVWKANLEMLAQFVHPHALDLIGYGKSRPKTSTLSRFGTIDQAKLVMRLIDMYEIDHFALGGLSWGSSVANEIIKMEGERVRLLLLVSPAVSPSTLAAPLVRGAIPTIIVACPQDPVVSISRSRQIHEKIPNSKFIAINAPEDTKPLARTHHVQSLCPIEFNERVSASLRTLLG